MLSFMKFNSPMTESLFDNVSMESVLDGIFPADNYFTPMRDAVKTVDTSLGDIGVYTDVVEYGERGFIKFALFAGNAGDWAEKENILRVMCASLDFTGTAEESCAEFAVDFFSPEELQITTFEELKDVMEIRSEIDMTTGVLENGWEWFQTTHITTADGGGVQLFVINIPTSAEA